MDILFGVADVDAFYKTDPSPGTLLLKTMLTLLPWTAVSRPALINV
jgi:hypothetical protein